MYRKAFVGQIGDMFIMTALSAHTLMYSTSAKRKPGTTWWQTTKQGRGCASCIHHPPTESNCTAVQMWNLLAQWYFTIAQLCKLRRSRYCALGSRRELLWRRSSSAIETSALAPHPHQPPTNNPPYTSLSTASPVLSPCPLGGRGGGLVWH